MKQAKKDSKNHVRKGSIAILRNTRLSPTKARLIAREVQGMNAELALASLELTPNKAARIIYKTLASAIANGGYEASQVDVTSCKIDKAMVLRRFTPRARGRATPIRKPMAHIYVEVNEATKSQKSKHKGQKMKNTESNDVKTNNKKVK